MGLTHLKSILNGKLALGGVSGDFDLSDRCNISSVRHSEKKYAQP